MKNIELVMSLEQIKEDYPLGSDFIEQVVHYKVRGYFRVLPTAAFASFPGIKVEEVKE